MKVEDNKGAPVSIITVCFNADRHVDLYARSIAEQTYLKLELILVDNGSDDGSFKRLEELLPDGEFIELNENKGFSYANNL